MVLNPGLLQRIDRNQYLQLSLSFMSSLLSHHKGGLNLGDKAKGSQRLDQYCIDVSYTFSGFINKFIDGSILKDLFRF